MSPRRGIPRARDVSIRFAPPVEAFVPPTPPPPVDDQLEFFPIAVTITPLNPRAVLGAATRVRGVWRVEYPGERRPHLVYHDRHGWYCEDHGPACRAVTRVRGH